MDDDKTTRRLSMTGSPGRPAEETQAPFHPLSPPRRMSAPRNEIALDSLRAGDEIVIETTHSVYRFIVTDPLIPSGRLAGGVLGDQSQEAALIAGGRKTDRPGSTHKKLEAGLKVTFLIEWADGFRRLTTSRAVSFALQKRRRDGDHFSGPRILRLEHLASDQSD